ncbi:MAG: NADH:ubiquinone reductase (Na(+)-transporting) subunit A, partial [Candidatus Marinimicrobia bacterium]|nr:NADH:ubiquinone reductase (Na(+)-transporting) subunit A [Candidatus Neomarinimicrobiota bacterium]
MANVKVKKGFDIRIAGKSEKITAELKDPKIVGLVPPDFRGVKVKLIKKEGEDVKAGTPLFFDKNFPDIKFASPVSGKVRNIEYGARRVIQSISIDNDEKYTNEDFKSYSDADLSKASREELQDNLLKSGLWPHLKQRPFDKIAKP